MPDQTFRRGQEPRDDVETYVLIGEGKPYTLDAPRPAVAALTLVRDEADVRTFAREWGALQGGTREPYARVRVDAFVLRQVLELHSKLQDVDAGGMRKRRAVKELRDAKVREWLNGQWPTEPASGNDAVIVAARRQWLADRVSERLESVTFKLRATTHAAAGFAVEPASFPHLLTAIWWAAATWIASGDRVALCQHCHGVFSPAHGNARFCKPVHSQAYRDAKRYAQRQRRRSKR